MGMVSALYAYKMSYFIKEIKALNNKLLEKSIIVVNNKYIHGLLHMIFLIEKPIAPVYIKIPNICLKQRTMQYIVLIFL